MVAGDLRLLDEVRSGSSYLSQEDMRLHFGLGARGSVDLVRVHWPAGGVREIVGPVVDRLHVVSETP